MNRSTVNNLPLEIVIEVKRRLRSKQFDQIDITNWLNGQGFCISKSALNRYAIKLAQDDAAGKPDRELSAIQGADVAALFEELTLLKAREPEILAQIKCVMTSKA